MIAVAGLGGGLVACADDSGTAASESDAVPEASAAPRPDLPTTGGPAVDMCSDEVMARMTAAGYELTNHDTAADWCDFEDPATGRLALLMNDPALQYDVIAAGSEPKPARGTVAPDAPESLWVVEDTLVTAFSQCLAGEMADDGMQYVLVTEHGATSDACAGAVEAYETAIG
ncbi:hypothetical protein D4R08_00365 [Corynebacterium xerosis]|nr:hypothetical protein D4R08_00365 [Corynebacterium xerosis]